MADGKKLNGKQRIWRVIRDKKSVTADDLVEIASVKRRYALHVLGVLTAREVLAKMSATRWRLVADDPETPVIGKHDGSRRQKKLEALARLDAAFSAILEARLMIADIND